MSRSAVRVRSSALFFPANHLKTRSPRCSCRGLCQQYVSSRLYPNASSSELACYRWLQGTAGGVGELSGIERLTDVPGFWRLRHTGRGVAAPGPSRCAYSPKCVEGKFCELLQNGVLRSSFSHLTQSLQKLVHL